MFLLQEEFAYIPDVMSDMPYLLNIFKLCLFTLVVSNNIEQKSFFIYNI